jgi:PadR family transcriptional regulator, regulatory protein PadR
MRQRPYQYSADRDTWRRWCDAGFALSETAHILLEHGTLHYRILGIVEYSDDSKDRRITQLRKGILELAVMGVLYHERHYGYSLVRVISETGAISLKEGTIYPILARLDRDGLVRSEWVESDQGPPRKYYALTASGRQLFDALSQEFAVLVSLVQHQWKVPEHAERPGKKLFVRKA